ncbi:hypothetical protein [Lentzea sp. NPDC051838]|uniref:LppU/SCO3897 family protein n=1 Tax=Lentzea sp. NPDC051838 TaxID=3154849 RepID=UPI00342215ED
MTTPNYPQQPGPYGPPPGGQPQQPYGQQPPAYGQPGQPQGQPGQYGPPPGDPYGPPPGGMPPGGMPPGGMPPGQPMPYAQPPKKGGAGKIIGSILGFLLIAGVIAVVKFGIGSGINAISEPDEKPGECASVTGTTISPKYKKVDCGAAEANYFIAKVTKNTSEACPSDDYAEYTETGRRSASLKLCLVEKLEEGKCYQEEIAKLNMDGMKPVSCPAAPNEFAIMKILKIEKVTKAATAECGEATAVSYTDPSPGITYCVSVVEGK